MGAMELACLAQLDRSHRRHDDVHGRAARGRAPARGGTSRTERCRDRARRGRLLRARGDAALPRRRRLGVSAAVDAPPRARRGARRAVGRASRTDRAAERDRGRGRAARRRIAAARSASTLLDARRAARRGSTERTSRARTSCSQTRAGCAHRRGRRGDRRGDGDAGATEKARRVVVEVVVAAGRWRWRWRWRRRRRPTTRWDRARVVEVTATSEAVPPRTARLAEPAGKRPVVKPNGKRPPAKAKKLASTKPAATPGPRVDDRPRQRRRVDERGWRSRVDQRDPTSATSRARARRRRRVDCVRLAARREVDSPYAASVRLGAAPSGSCSSDSRPRRRSPGPRPRLPRARRLVVGFFAGLRLGLARASSAFGGVASAFFVARASSRLRLEHQLEPALRLARGRRDDLGRLAVLPHQRRDVHRRAERQERRPLRERQADVARVGLLGAQEIEEEPHRRVEHAGQHRRPGRR